uniref:Uncharacterized protein n=1 Tax=Spongospora subterranea TaxID=70186 RepID=A0A0H5QU12_9EUKA|eukprot:CRZ05380.1 hypothetical protein [Spongospora subterranea]
MDNVGVGEIVGLHSDSNGRSCESHGTCGNWVNEGDLIRFKVVIVDFDGQVEQAIACHRIRDGVESCRVGFLQRSLVARSKERFANKFGQVLQLYENCDNVVKRNKSFKNKGMASFRLLEYVPVEE